MQRTGMVSRNHTTATTLPGQALGSHAHDLRGFMRCLRRVRVGSATDFNIGPSEREIANLRLSDVRDESDYRNIGSRSRTGRGNSRQIGMGVGRGVRASMS